MRSLCEFKTGKYRIPADFQAVPRKHMITWQGWQHPISSIICVQEIGQNKCPVTIDQGFSSFIPVRSGVEPSDRCRVIIRETDQKRSTGAYKIGRLNLSTSFFKKQTNTTKTLPQNLMKYGRPGFFKLSQSIPLSYEHPVRGWHQGKLLEGAKIPRGSGGSPPPWWWGPGGRALGGGQGAKPP